MAGKVRVSVWGTVGKSIAINPADLEPRVAALESAIGTLGARANNPGQNAHSRLSGLQDGDDHPQYTMWEADERIIGQWQWAKSLWGPDGSAAAPSFTFTDDTDTGVYRVGADNLGIATGGTLRWDVDASRTYQSVPFQVEMDVAASSQQNFVKLLSPNTSSGEPSVFEVTAFESASGVANDDTGWQLGMWEGSAGGNYPPASVGSGYRWRYFGELGSEAPNIDRNALVFYGHVSSASGTEVYRHNKDFYPGQMLFAPGTAAAPTISFRDFPGSGIYSDSQNVKCSVAGSLIYNVGATGVFYSQPLFASNGSANSPSITFNADGDNGFYFIAANSFGASVGGTLRLTFSTSAFTATLPWLGPLGSLSNVTYGFSGDPNTGMYSPGADAVALVTNGVARLTVQSGAFTGTFPWRGQNGSNTAPALSFSGDDNTGLYNVGADNLGITAGGTLCWDINTTRIVTTLPQQGPAASASTPTFSFSGDPNTGIYNVGADQLGIAAAGALVAQFDANAAAGNTRFLIYDVDNGTLERVSVGAADSGGAGFKVLRIPN